MSDKILCDNDTLKFIVRYRYSQNHEVVDVSDLDTSKCSSMEDLFTSMDEMREIRGLNKLDTSRIKNMSNMFSNCDALTSVDLSGLNLSNVTDMSYMFNFCQSLTSINLSGLNLSNVTDMNCMFCGCVSLTSIDLSGLNLSKNSKIDMTRIFDECYSLYHVIPPVTSGHSNEFKTILQEYGLDDEKRNKRYARIHSLIKSRTTPTSAPQTFPSIEQLKQQNESDISKINKLQQRVEKRTQLIQLLEQYDELMNEQI